MTPQNVLDVTRDSLTVVLFVCLPVVAVATIASLVVAILQAVTQVQDQSIGQSVRLVVVLVTVILAAGWLGGDVLRFAERAFRMVATLP
jgi:type III secretion protein S